MKDQRYRVLVAEDDRDIIDLLSLYLENAGFEVLTAENGLLAWECLEKEQDIDLVLMDIMMPEMTGYQLLRKMREHHNTPVIIISAKTEDSDKILGLDLGADDYVAKPFNPLEVVARVKSNIRRFYNLNDSSSDNEGQIRVGELILDVNNMTLKKGDEDIALTPMEYKILHLLMQNPGKVFTKIQIYQHASGDYVENDENTVMVHISNIREKIESDPKMPVYLKTIRGLGYKFEKK
ncbi:response regulator transcription factor [Oribacterium sp. WCC10]|uniref:response regulator transcription factor n=1 Tax=Oribacterium sp. WCC10 TaxID=1855343 RepID=UPI0008E3DDC8|nr:response regulator transcription factor [Oribacterium sp. WCC10]SFG18552.1 DNA-binding response regulator, OmpR family, contains REC and winged-helix (wHTH) domain [Oribacterium sp. WCC10]